MAIEIEYDGFKELGNPKGSAEETREHSFFGQARRHQTFLPWIHQISFNLASTFTPDSKQIDAQQECLVWVSGAVILVAMIMMKRQEDDGLALFMVLWCVSGIAMNLINKIATTVFPLPLTLLLLQMMIGVFVLLALFGPFQLIEELWDKSESVWRWSLITVPFAGMLITSILAFQEGHALTVLVLRNLLPLISLFLERVFLPETSKMVTMQGILSLTMIACGSFLYAYSELKTGNVSWWVILYLFINMLSTIVHRLIEKNLLTDNSMKLSFKAASLVNNLVGIVPVTIFLLAREEHHQWSEFFVSATMWTQPTTILSVAISGICGVSLGYSSIAVKKQLTATAMLTLQTTMKMVLIILAILILGEHLTTAAAFGCVLTIVCGAWYSVTTMSACK